MKKIFLLSAFSLFIFLGSVQMTAAVDSTNSITVKNGSGAVNSYTAAANSTSGDTSIPNPLGTTNINIFVSRIISYILGLIGTVSLLLFIYGGLIWMTSAGSSDKVKKGKDILVWAVIGMAVVFSSYILVKFIIQGAQGALK